MARLSRALALVLGMLLLARWGAAQPTDAIDALFDWIRALGGTVDAEVRLDPKTGLRGMFATKAIPKDGFIASIPAAAIINAGGLNESFVVPTLTVLRELKSPCSRFKPYIDMWPKPDGLVNSCNLDLKYAGMWKSEHWEKNQRDWSYYLKSLLDGSLNQDIEYTVQEVIGNANLTLDEVKYACAISSTRYVSTARRRRLLMAPIFDLANHRRHCTHVISAYETSDFLHFIAGEDVAVGDEICYSYGSLRDDYALAHYGFLPELEDPPRLALVDHPEFNPASPYSHDDPPSEEHFVGTREEMEAELSRLRELHDRIKATPDSLPPQQGDYIYDLFKELEQRRLAAIEYEINRISGELRDNKEL